MLSIPINCPIFACVQYNCSYWEGKQNINLVWDYILIIIILYLVITACHSDSLFLDLFSHKDTCLANLLLALTFLSLKITLAFKNPKFISVYLGFMGRAFFTDLSALWLILICSSWASRPFFNFFACLQALDSLYIGKHKTSSVSHQIPFFLSSAESLPNTCQGQHSWLLYLDRPSWESWETMWWCSKDIEMYMQGDFPWDRALTIVLAFASVRLQEQ